MSKGPELPTELFVDFNTHVTALMKSSEQKGPQKMKFTKVVTNLEMTL